MKDARPTDPEMTTERQEGADVLEKGKWGRRINKAGGKEDILRAIKGR